MSTPQEKEVNEGESASFRCDAVGNPSPTIFWQQGEYICTAIVEGFKHASVSHFLHIRGPPIITVPAEATANLGESVEMSCHVSGRPKPLEVHQIPRSYGVESRLIIRDLREIDMGAYNCTANNGIGADAKAVTLRPRGVGNLFDDPSDVTVKCEVLDGTFFPEMYSCADGTNIASSKVSCYE
ncbi:unnamed protein product [Strongylus vulgaris]|uniref:Ig-like domain-containing protein n=1 Tax=Strongylus vulgaris TaxID=40348 RepID=A0A3P7LP40_STRVU|nr:unnamed protein product [Strongylus vulgaris]